MFENVLVYGGKVYGVGEDEAGPEDVGLRMRLCVGAKIGIEEGDEAVGAEA